MSTLRSAIDSRRAKMDEWGYKKLLKGQHIYLKCILGFGLWFNPPVREANREVANLTERKNPHTPVYGVKEFVCLSVVIHVTSFSSIPYCIWNKTSILCLLFQRRQFRLNCVKTLLWKLLRKLLHYLPKITLHKSWSQIFNTKIATQTCTIRRGYEIWDTNFTST